MNTINKVIIAAEVWKFRGWHVLPVQPGTKRLVCGYGVNLKNADSWGDMDFWFQTRICNLAVFSPSGLILDFDDIAAYRQFEAACPEAAASYTESTPRGGRHIFLVSCDRVRFGAFDGVEVKRAVLVWPSLVEGKPYAVQNPGHILTLPVGESLESFFKARGGKLPAFPPARVLSRPEVKQGRFIGRAENRGIMAKAKQAWPLASYLARFEPGLILAGGDRWRSGRCPWHEDTRPSLWVDLVRDLWGCHGCTAHGDIVNWHALRIGAPSQLAAALDLVRLSGEG
jgi:hypothetical protein